MAATTRKTGIVHEVEAHQTAFSIAFIGIFTLSFVFLDVVGYVPDPAAAWNTEHGGTPVAAAEAATPSSSSSVTRAPSSTGELPLRIVIDAIDLKATIGNSDTTDAAVLDKFLKSGAVRYPTSGLLGLSGTVLLFGHSSYLPIVANQAYKTFDGIQNLHAGDEISVYSSDREYRYDVTNVTKVQASDGTVALKTDGQYLTLVTCDSFDKALQDRWVVEAKLVGTYTLASN